ncbi:MAG: excisionase family DNA-binding protein [Prevotellaceae bacterium]|jgi:excisionase family DNA binding protein|nr:excisionase family DNA-binding protein [Prevotellaceae bacterium]
MGKIEGKIEGKILENILEELRGLKNVTLLGIKKVLTVSDAALLTGLDKYHIRELVFSRKIPYHQSQSGELVCFDKSELEEWMLQQRVETVAPADEEIYQLLSTSICDFGLSERVTNCLKTADIKILADLVPLSRENLMPLRHFGKKSMEELDELLEKHNLSFGMDVAKYYLNRETRPWKERNPFYTFSRY